MKAIRLASQGPQLASPRCPVLASGHIDKMLLSCEVGLAGLASTSAAHRASLHQAACLSVCRHGSMAVSKPDFHSACASGLLLSKPLSLALLLQGVASGDPYAKSVILWARVTPPSSAAGKPAAVHWAVSRDRRFRKIESSGSTVTNGDVDYTVKARRSLLLDFAGLMLLPWLCTAVCAPPSPECCCGMQCQLGILYSVSCSPNPAGGGAQAEAVHEVLLPVGVPPRRPREPGVLMRWQNQNPSTRPRRCSPHPHRLLRLLQHSAPAAATCVLWFD